jgi:hypothetical protein
MRVIARSSGYAAALLLAGTAALAAPAAAQASAALPGPTVVPCSSSALVSAINQANAARFAVLLLSRGCNYVLTTAAAGDDGLPPVTGRITVIGGPGTQISRSPAAGPFRILDVTSGGALTLANLTVANGKLADPSNGGGILDLGSLALRNVSLTGNTGGSEGVGGALFVGIGARATISGSELDGNSASAGGAIFSLGNLAINQSALDRNTTPANGGAIFADAGSTTLISLTSVTRNSAGIRGGGILNVGTLVLRADRVTFNHASREGGGIFNAGSGTVSLRFTLVAFNTPDNCSPQGTIRGCRH